MVAVSKFQVPHAMHVSERNEPTKSYVLDMRDHAHPGRPPASSAGFSPLAAAVPAAHHDDVVDGVIIWDVIMILLSISLLFMLCFMIVLINDDIDEHVVNDATGDPAYIYIVSILFNPCHNKFLF